MTNDLMGQQPRPVVAAELGQLFPSKLLPRLRETLRLCRYSLKTEKAYLQCVRRHIHFHGKRHPKEMGAKEVTTFLTRWASKRQVAHTWQGSRAPAMENKCERLECRGSRPRNRIPMASPTAVPAA